MFLLQTKYSGSRRNRSTINKPKFYLHRQRPALVLQSEQDKGVLCSFA